MRKRIAGLAIAVGLAGSVFAATPAQAVEWHKNGLYDWNTCDRVGYYGLQGGGWSDYFCYPNYGGKYWLYVLY